MEENPFVTKRTELYNFVSIDNLGSVIVSLPWIGSTSFFKEFLEKKGYTVASLEDVARISLEQRNALSHSLFDNLNLILSDEIFVDEEKSRIVRSNGSSLEITHLENPHTLHFGEDDRMNFMLDKYAVEYGSLLARRFGKTELDLSPLRDLSPGEYNLCLKGVGGRYPLSINAVPSSFKLNGSKDKKYSAVGVPSQ